MFGDAGHGMIMLLAALTFILFERKLTAMKIKDEIFSTFFNGRYIVLMMGIFSIYTGIVYNEFYSRSLNIFSSQWTISTDTATSIMSATKDTPVTLDPKFATANTTYAYGMDPIWNLATNKLNFFNSFKMKMSVILGVTQMAFGVLLSLMNYRYFKSKLDIFGVFVPQLVFLSAIFVYLCAQIIAKWLNFSVFPATTGVGFYPGPHCAPSLLIGLISMFMMNRPSPQGFVSGAACSITNPGNCTELEQCSLHPWYQGQVGFELFLVLMAVVAIPWMLLTKPLVLRSRNKKQAPTVVVRANVSEESVEVIGKDDGPPSNGKAGHLRPPSSSSSGESSHSAPSPPPAGGGGHGHGEEFEFSEVMIHQIIHTIEFCLGCISHTASYLRLWALSLAHSELSEVLWTMILRMGFTMFPGSYAGGVMLWAIFWAFSALTVAVLILMEGLSAFLHALRLHWVEFQSKFYAGSGYAFAPFSFEAILDDEEA